MTNPIKPSLDMVFELLDLEKIEENIFRGQSPEGKAHRIFGGQVLGQALVAASRTVNGRVCHSFHGYFLRAGDPKIPVLYDVDRSRDGSSFSSRRVTAIQHGQQIFNLAASFQVVETGLEHQIEMPSVPGPDELVDDRELFKQFAEKLPEEMRIKAQDWLSSPQAIETRSVQPVDRLNPQPRDPIDYVWIKSRNPIPDDVIAQQSMLAYASDLSLMATALLPHGRTFGATLQAASLDHSMWFHHPFKLDEWMLYAKDSPVSSASRGLNRGSIFTRDGKLVASVAQEGLMRVREPRDGT